MTVQASPTVTRTERYLLVSILTAYTVLAIIYSLLTPIFEASDELWHYPMVQHIATTGQLPVQDPANPGPWRQEGSQPPLYYMLAALLTAGIDTSDMMFVRRQNPHADIGVVLPDNNINMMTHRPDREAFPWQGTVLAVHIARFFSVALGAGTVYVTYLLARQVFPYAAVVHLGAAALVAFLPMFLFISGSVNNDNLSNFLGNLLLLLIIRLLMTTHMPRLRDYALIGIVTGAGLLAKFNIGFLILLVVVALAVVSYRQRSLRPFLIGGGISGALTILVAGWWYLRNWQLYGDPTGLNVFLDTVGRRLIVATPAQLWSERHSFTQAYWGFFGGVNVPLPQPVYLIFNIIGGLGLIGAAVFIVYRLAGRGQQALAFSGWLPVLFTLIWPLVSFASFLRWTAETPASQGRLMFGALSAISLWMAVGLVWWLPHRLRPLVMAAVAGYFALIAAAAPFLVIAPAYEEPPVTQPAGEVIATFSAPDSGGLSLLAADILPQSAQVQPEDYVMLDTLWRIEQPLARDWSLFVHLVTPDGVILSQRDVYPAQGLLATSDLSAGRLWRSPAAVWVPPAAYAPMTLEVQVGWYHLPTGERLAQAHGTETHSLGHVELLPRSSPWEVPNPISVNFGNLIELVGYEVTDLSPAAGDSVAVTLYWRGLRQIEKDYKVFVSLLDPPTLAKYAASDAMPEGWTAPTSGWQPGELVTDTHELSVAPDAPPGIYELQVGLYEETESGLQRLRVFTPDGGQANDFIYLSRMRILPVEQESGS